jgi:demethylmenaquinone methyltransferase/2-methoxy-6-polyprenyl-1,4-benzoquinol methylase
MIALVERGLETPTPGSPEKDAVRAMFDRIAPRYDLLNHLLSLGIDVSWRRAAVSALDLPPGSRVLDLCTGTADLLIAVLGRDLTRRGVGIDLSASMLGLGAEKLRRRGLAPRASLLRGDAERLAVKDAAFDGALVAFGIRNVGDVAAALRELHRVLRPGGRLVILEFAMPKGLLGAAYRFYFRRILPLVGGLLSGDRTAYSYLPASVSRFPEPGLFQEALAGAGFRDVRARPLTLGSVQLYGARRG